MLVTFCVRRNYTSSPIANKFHESIVVKHRLFAIVAEIEKRKEKGRRTERHFNF